MCSLVSDVGSVRSQSYLEMNDIVEMSNFLFSVHEQAKAWGDALPRATQLISRRAGAGTWTYWHGFCLRGCIDIEGGSQAFHFSIQWYVGDLVSSVPLCYPAYSLVKECKR